MSGFYRKDRVELLAEKHHLKFVADCSLVESLLKACIFFEIEQVEDGVVYKAVLEVVAKKHMLHNVGNYPGIITRHIARHYDKRKACLVSGSDNFLVHRLDTLFAREIHHGRDSFPGQGFYGIALGLHIVFHPGKSCKGHHSVCAAAFYCFGNTGFIHNRYCFYSVFNLSFACNHYTVSERVKLQAILNCYFHLLPLFLSPRIRFLPDFPGLTDHLLPDNLRRTSSVLP